MESSDEYNKSLNEAYRRIGRNVFVFQQIEMLLKTLLNNGRFVGTASQLKKHLAERTTKPDKRMLGSLINPLVEHHLTPADPEASLPESDTEITLSFGITFEHTAETRAAFQQKLEAMVEERNNLIHTLLARFRFDSAAGCQAASEDLERQHAQILPVKNRLLELVTMMKDMKPDLLKALQDMRKSHAADSDAG